MSKISNVSINVHRVYPIHWFNKTIKNIRNVKIAQDRYSSNLIPILAKMDALMINSLIKIQTNVKYVIPIVGLVMVAI